MIIKLYNKIDQILNRIKIFNFKIKQKYELREEIIYTSQAVIEVLKERIDKIVRIYEVEKV